MHLVHGLFLETVNRADACHDAVADIHNHAGRKEEGADTECRHDTDQVDEVIGKDTLVVTTKEVVPTQQE